MTPVGNSPDLERILRLPSISEARLVSGYWTKALRKPGSSMRLWPHQEEALWAASDYGGLVGILPVGSGKTLLAALIPAVVKGRTVLLTEGGLVKQAENSLALYADHWHVGDVQVMSYSVLQGAEGYERLLALGPENLIADEAHTLGRRNKRSARVRKYIRQNPTTRFFCMSGTLLQKSLMDLWEIFSWALGDSSPLPRHYPAAREWAEAIDPPRYPNFARRPAGALQRLCAPGESAEKAVSRKIRQSPGVVTRQTQSCTMPLNINTVDIPTPETVKRAAAKCRKIWELPDGTRLGDPMQQARYERQLVLGYWVDSSDTVRWVADGLVPWLRSFEAFHGPLVVWVDSLAFGRDLSNYLGWPFYAADGSGILNERGERTIIATIQAHGTGRNLQGFSKAINLCWVGGGARWEQLLGRLHREGQSRPVSWYVPRPFVGGLRKALRESRWLQDMLQVEQKLVNHG